MRYVLLLFLAGCASVGNPRPVLPAETRVSYRSNATTGTPSDMYSIVLFIVEMSFNGFIGSGDSPMAAVDRYCATTPRSAIPVNVTWSISDNRSVSRDSAPNALTT